MKFDTIITGGGLAGLTAGIALAAKKQRVAIVSMGQSTLIFNSGSLGLLGFDTNHEELASPVAGFKLLAPGHPYGIIGDSMPRAIQSAKSLLEDAGLSLYGDGAVNHHRLSPLGVSRPAWLTLDGMVVLEDLKAKGFKKVAVAGLAGYLDFSPRFFAAGLNAQGFETEIVTVDTGALHHLRRNGTEMRAANIARMLDAEDIDELANAINKATTNADAVILPAVVGLKRPDDWQHLRQSVGKPLYYASTLGASVPGMIIERKLARRFAELGGTMLRANGDFAEDYMADNYIYAAGRYFSHGLSMTPTGSYTEAGFDLELPAETRFAPDMFAPQPYMKAGIKPGPDFKCMRDGKVLGNCYAAGSVLAGADSLKEDSGAGVAMLTAIYVSNKIAE